MSKTQRKLLSEIMPELRSEWDESKNSELRLSFGAITSGSNKKVWWKCSKGHEWKAAPHNRSKGTGCPYCAGLIPEAGVNDLATANPDLLKEWDYDKNIALDPSKLLAKSNKKAWWKCEKGHQWESAIYSRTSGSGCPFCGNKKLLKGYNDLATTNPELLREWDYKKNSQIDVFPEQVLASSITLVWWKCSKGHEWNVAIRYRAMGRGTGCPICSGNIVKEGVNDLATTNPELIEEWNYEKNGDSGITPNSIGRGSEKKVWWVCSKCGHEWSSRIHNRLKGSGCPRCSRIQHTSLPEQAILFYIRKFFPDTIGSYKPDYLNGQELDVFIPSLNIGVEYDGRAWHKNAKRDEQKNANVTDNGVILVRIREPGCAELHPVENVFIIETEEPTVDAVFLDGAIKKLLVLLSEFSATEIDAIVSIKDDFYSIMDSFQAGIKEKSITAVKPELLKEWNYKRNKVKPETVSSKSGRKIWWKCSKGHEWQAPVYRRVDGSGCPFCSNQKVLIGFNDLPTTNPELLKEWNYDKNTDTSVGIIAGTGKKVWWKCSKGHEWRAAVSSRSSGTGCPYCAGLIAETGVNDLATTDPELIEEWDFKKNKILGVTPHTISRGSKRKVWWVCPKGHSYISSVGHRSSKKANCPYCSGHKVLEGFNDLATTNPELLEEWDFKKNKILGVTPYTISRGSKRKVWWVCSKGHSYISSVGHRSSKKANCPYCSGHKVLEGFNDLATTNPELLEEWDFERNESLGIDPYAVSRGSNKKVWWKCSNGHSWCAVVVSRNNGNGCPYCSGHKVLKGFNDLPATRPELLNEWNFEKNVAERITPDNITKGSDKKVWWKCSICGYEWKASVGSRSRGHGCQKCGIEQSKKVRDLGVQIIETGDKFESVAEAAIKKGIPRKTLIDHLKGKIENAGNQHWEYIGYKGED